MKHIHVYTDNKKNNSGITFSTIASCYRKHRNLETVERCKRAKTRTYYVADNIHVNQII